MSLADLFAIETSISDLKNPRLWLERWGGVTTRAGIQVGPQKAMGLSAYYACIHAISVDSAKLPLKVYERLERGKRPRPDHDVYRILHDSPNRNMTAINFRESLTSHALGWGNGFAEIQRDNRWRIRGLHLIHPMYVKVDVNDKGRMVYEIQQHDGQDKYSLDSDHMFHIHGLGDDGLQGYSVARIGCESLGLSMAAQQFGAAFFGNGSTLSGLLYHPGELGDEAKERLAKSWKETYGGPDNAGGTAILEEGMKYEKIGIPPDEAQFLETRQFQIEEIARWFRMPPHKLQHLLRATFSNIEHQSIEYVQDTLLPWLIRWEQEIQRKLFLESESELFAEHVVAGLLRGDKAGQATYYKELWQIGAISQNEIREFENMNPIDDGDVYYVPLNMARTDLPPEDREKDSKSMDDNDAEAYQGTLHKEIEGNPAVGMDGNGVGKIYSAMYPLFVDAASQVLKKEQCAAIRAAKRFDRVKNRPAFQTWCDHFFGQEHYQYILRLFESRAVVLVDIMGLSEWEGDQIIKSHILRSKELVEKCFHEGTMEFEFMNYTESRADDLARMVMGDILNGTFK